MPTTPVHLDDLTALHEQVRAAASRSVCDAPGPSAADVAVERFLRVADYALANARYHLRTGEDTTMSEDALVRVWLRIFAPFSDPESTESTRLYAPDLDPDDAYAALRLIVAETEHVTLED